MLKLEYGSDEDSDVETVQTPAKTSEPPPPPSRLRGTSVDHNIGDGLQLPPPTNKSSRRKDGPVKIKINALDPTISEAESGPLPKKLQTETRGAGSSSLVSMLSKLPAPKVAPRAPQPARVLGGGVKSSDSPGVLVDLSHSDSNAPSSAMPDAGVGDQDPSASATKFLPSSIGRLKPKPTPPKTPLPPSLESSLTNTPQTTQSTSTPQLSTPTPVMDFFSLGAGTASHASSSKPASPAPSLSISSAPSVTEWQPPPPSMNDPYPGYYQKQSGEWAAYDPEYYKSFWETWNLEAVSGTQGKGKRKERGWEGAEADDAQPVDAHEEMQKSQLAEMEATKNLTAAPNAPSAQPKMNIKTGNYARRKGQLSSLLVEAYQNREVIEAKLAEGRRNRKEAGLKYGF